MRRRREFNKTTLLCFLERLNQHNADRLTEMMTEDRVFIDSPGHVVHGGQAVRVGWRGYYVLYPDYWVSHEEIFSAGDRIAIIGAAGGTIAAVGGACS